MNPGWALDSGLLFIERSDCPAIAKVFGDELSLNRHPLAGAARSRGQCFAPEGGEMQLFIVLPFSTSYGEVRGLPGCEEAATRFLASYFSASPP